MSDNFAGQAYSLANDLLNEKEAAAAVHGAMQRSQIRRDSSSLQS
jgi:hypothetical protein